MSEKQASEAVAMTMTTPQWLGALADAWDLGYHRALIDTTSDLEPADNPYRVTPKCDHPGLGHGFGMHTGICPKCRECKFIGHGPLCGDCYDRSTPDPAPNTAAGGVADVTTGGK